ncbi:YbaK/EbsC family protein [Bombilactobacillus apium]|uniref:YbaK/EbsC family protein n=1 Tax=Bombilactobacillus apium TaxID=2675299 RepID=UPI002B4B33FF|nr:YbaK/EbsC family protein [Bombilactobacillus apium]
MEAVRQYLKPFGLEDRVQEHEQPIDTVTHAAQVLACQERQILKSMTFLVREQPILIALAGDARVDNRKFKNCFQSRVKMIPFDQVETSIGHAPGGVTPFAVNSGVQVYLDESLRRFTTVYAAGGSLQSTIARSIPELEQATQAQGWVDVGKGWQLENSK